MKCNHCHRRISSKEKICPYCGKEVVDNRKKNIKEIVILLVMIFIMIFSPRAIRMMKRGPGIPNNTINYESMTFDQIITQNLDKHNTLAFLSLKERDLIEYINNNNYTIDSSTQSVYESNASLRAMTYIRFSKKDNINYNVSVAYEKGVLKESEFVVDYIKDIKDKDKFEIPEDKVNTLCKEINIDSAYNLLKRGHSLMKQNELTLAYEYESKDKYEILLKEMIKDDHIECKYSIRYEVN